jgi:hypothetical protein
MHALHRGVHDTLWPPSPDGHEDAADGEPMGGLVGDRTGSKTAERSGRHGVAAKVVGASGAALVFTAVAADPAAAHYVYQKAKVYVSDTNCTGARAETSHGGGGGYSKSDVYSWYRWEIPMAGGYDCQTDLSRPAGYLATRFTLYKWNGSSWAACQSFNYHYNSTNTHQFAIYKDFGSKAPCGAGTYNTFAESYVLNGGSWFGGGLWSGNHTL